MQLFVKQLKEKIIPAFEAAHGPGYQALFMIDNSQGHSAYSEDALLAQRMNLNPGGKQARLRDGWYLDADKKRKSAQRDARCSPRTWTLAIRASSRVQESMQHRS
ncbi:hypothetical protein MIND_00302800 [Mycena indigotica]|uniref:Uncharacterized protein n=1 Tax=Mycena indigotica TaxID=2126181 RepID=A0A8H6T4L7_9AGAR|nr:uncharacterized protein MIND_00302800 [Mycena indigotica]KAF7309325.1 hypothetical protein MIND_00302800 [Mycena indigotica]